MKTTKQYFPEVLFSMLYMLILTFKSVDEILKCRVGNNWLPVKMTGHINFSSDIPHFWLVRCNVQFSSNT